jgi:hypothetical protein
MRDRHEECKAYGQRRITCATLNNEVEHVQFLLCTWHSFIFSWLFPLPHNHFSKEMMAGLKLENAYLRYSSKGQAFITWHPSIMFCCFAHYNDTYALPSVFFFRPVLDITVLQLQARCLTDSSRSPSQMWPVCSKFSALLPFILRSSLSLTASCESQNDYTCLFKISDWVPLLAVLDETEHHLS